LEIVQYAQECGNRAVGRKSDADETNRRKWSGEKEKLEGIYKNECYCHGQLSTE
jgi:hypothetical protein